MARKYSHSPEPRYVKLAQNVVNGVNPEDVKPESYKIIKNIYSVADGFRVVYSVKEEDAEIEIPLEGTDDVVVDVDEANKMINIHLDAATRTKIGRALLIPTGQITEPLIVSIGTNGAQTSLKLGEGLTIEAGVIKSKTTFSLDGTTLNITSN